MALVLSYAVTAAFGPPMSGTGPDLVNDDDTNRPKLTSLDPTWIHGYECDMLILDCLLSRLGDHTLSVHPIPHPEQMKLGKCLRTNIPMAALLIEYTAQPGLVTCARLPNPLDIFITTLLSCARSSRGMNF